MKRINQINLNTQTYWDEHIAEPDFGLRQREYLKLAGTGKNIMEIGCGLSPFLDKARKKFEKCFGIDFSPKTIERAKKKYPNVNYRKKSAYCTGYYEKVFEVTVAGELIEHLKWPDILIDEMARITKRRIIISTAKMEYNDPEHIWEFTDKDLMKLGEKYGRTEVKEIKSKRFKGRSYLFMTIDL